MYSNFYTNQTGGDFDPISYEDVEYDPETMFRFKVGNDYFVLTNSHLINMSRVGRTIRNPVTNRPFTREDSQNLLDFVATKLPTEYFKIKHLIHRSFGESDEESGLSDEESGDDISELFPDEIYEELVEYFRSKLDLFNDPEYLRDTGPWTRVNAIRNIQRHLVEDLPESIWLMINREET